MAEPVTLDRRPAPLVGLRPIATPLPLGFLGQAVASWSFACLQLSWIGTDQGHTVALAVLVFTVPLQLVSTIWGFVARDPVAATGTGLLAGGWAATALATLTSPPGATSAGLGVVLVGIAVALAVPALTGVTRLAAFAVLALSVARFATTGVAELVGTQLWLTVAGWVGFALAITSTYAALAFEIEAATGRPLLPIIRWATKASGAAPTDAEEVWREPGVRRQL